MARPRPTATTSSGRLASNTPPLSSASTPASGRLNSCGDSSIAGPSRLPLRSSSRRRQSVAATQVSEPTPVAAYPLSPVSPPPSTPPSRPILPKNNVEPKAHGLRNVLSARERQPCPFPDKYKGRDYCGVSEEDESDDVLMAICAACAEANNRALSPEHIARVVLDRGWIRPPSAAVSPALMISNTIRQHQTRCQKAIPARPSLLTKYQLSGSIAEAALESALPPGAFDGISRPKGPFWFLSSDVGQCKWVNPFSGLFIPKAPIRKPVPKVKTLSTGKSSSIGARSEIKKKKDYTSNIGHEDALPTVPRIKLRLTATVADAAATADESDVGSSSPRSRSLSRSRETSTSIVQPMPTTSNVRRRRQSNLFDSSESETSDSEGEGSPLPYSHSVSGPLRRPRRGAPPPLSITHSSRFAHLPPRSTLSPFGELFFSPIQAYPTLAHTSQSPFPFPSHSLDNTTWGARGNADTQHALETSSSSSDDDMRELDWATGSGIMIKADDNERIVIKAADDDDDDTLPFWGHEEEAKLIAATDAMRELAAISYVAAGTSPSTAPAPNQLDNRPPLSDTSSIADSSSTATAHAVSQGKLKSLACPAALPAWTLSSPISSPRIGYPVKLPQFNLETSPTQRLSRLHRFENKDIDDMTMDVDGGMDVDQPDWLDETGQLPVQAGEDPFSDVEVSSITGDISTPERDRQLHTAEWAREAAAIADMSIIVKQEPEDYPSPATTDGENAGMLHFHAFRESSTSTQSPCSGSSELPPFEIDSEEHRQVLVGPESVKVEELDAWLEFAKAERTPHRGRNGRTVRHDAEKDGGTSRSWGAIGVGHPFVSPISSLILSKTSTPSSRHTPSRNRALRSSGTRRGRSAARKSDIRVTPSRTPEVVLIDALPVLSSTSLPKTQAINVDEMEFDDAIGPADLDRACAEAEASEEIHRAQSRAKAEESQRRFDMCRQAFRDAATGTEECDTPAPTPFVSASWPEPQPSPWADIASPWGLSESIPNVATPTTLSPLALQSLHISNGPHHIPGPVPADGTQVFVPSLDPKCLRSPPIDGGHMMMLDGVLSQTELEGQLSVEPNLGVLPPIASPDGLAVSPTPVSFSPPVIDMAPKSPTKPIPSVAPVALGPAVELKLEVSTPSPGPPQSDISSPLSSPPLVPASVPVVPDSAAAVPVSAPLHASASSSAPAARPATLSRTASPVTRTSTTSPASSASNNGGVGGSNSSGSTRPTTPAPSQATTKRLLPGIDACVIDNLPCYSHVWDTKSAYKCTVLRRLDTDFVNGTALLSALGVPSAQHSNLLDAPPANVAFHRTVPLVSQGHHHAAGVPGVWIPLVEARDLARKLGLQDTRLLANILREDLFQLFKELAGISLRHTSSTESFGMPFVAQPHLRNGMGPPANSRSTPNLAALGTSLPTPSHLRTVSTSAAGTAKPSIAGVGPKGPLIRSAPSTPPDGGPPPKRRRATVVGGTAGPVARALTVSGHPHTVVRPHTAGTTPVRPTITQQQRKAIPTPLISKDALQAASVPALKPVQHTVQSNMASPPPDFAQTRRTRASIVNSK